MRKYINKFSKSIIMRINKMEYNKKLLKYILMGMVVIIATRYIPTNTIATKEIITIGAISSISFALLDMSSPSIKINVSKL